MKKPLYQSLYTSDIERAIARVIRRNRRNACMRYTPFRKKLTHKPLREKPLKNPVIKILPKKSDCPNLMYQIKGEDGKRKLYDADGSEMTKEQARAAERLLTQYSKARQAKVKNKFKHVILSTVYHPDDFSEREKEEFLESITEMFAVRYGNHGYHFSVHEDTDNLHVHLIITAKSVTGDYLNTDREHNADLRKDFAERIREIKKQDFYCTLGVHPSGSRECSYKRNDAKVLVNRERRAEELKNTQKILKSKRDLIFLQYLKTKKKKITEADIPEYLKFRRKYALRALTERMYSKKGQNPFSQDDIFLMSQAFRAGKADPEEFPEMPSHIIRLKLKLAARAMGEETERLYAQHRLLLTHRKSYNKEQTAEY